MTTELTRRQLLGVGLGGLGGLCLRKFHFPNDPPVAEPPSVHLTKVPGSQVETYFQAAKDTGKTQPWYVFAYNEGMGRIALDGNYWLPDTLADLQAMVSWAAETKQVIEDRYDCDKFAIHLKATIDHDFLCNGVGIVVDWSSFPVSHSYNLAMLAGGAVLVVEPQWGTGIYTLREKSNVYQLKWGQFLF